MKDGALQGHGRGIDETPGQARPGQQLLQGSLDRSAAADALRAQGLNEVAIGRNLKASLLAEERQRRRQRLCRDVEAVLLSGLGQQRALIGRHGRRDGGRRKGEQAQCRSNTRRSASRGSTCVPFPV